MEEVKTNRGESTPAGQFTVPKDLLEFYIKNKFLMFSPFLVSLSSLSSLVGDGGISVVAMGLFQTFDLCCFLPADKVKSSECYSSLVSVPFLLEPRVCTSFLWIVQALSLEVIGIFWAFSAEG